MKNIEDPDVDKASVLGVVDLRAFDDDGVGRKVHAPGERGSADENLKYLFK